MRVFVIAKDITALPQEVAHLYEHWFIASLYEHARKALGASGGTIGYMGGNTFQNILFIEAWFYDGRVSALFDKFLADEILDDDRLDICMRQCAAEDRELWKVTDAALLRRQLAGLRRLPWNMADNIEPYVYDDTKQPVDSPLRIRKSAASYRTVTLLMNLENGSLEEKALLLRLYVIIGDIIGSFIQQKGWYELDTLSPRENDDGVYFIASVSLPRGSLTNAELQKEVRSYLNDFDLAANMPFICAHIDEYGRQPLWKGRIREELHHIDIVAGNAAIAQLATEERIRDILGKLEIITETVSYSFAKNLQY